MLNVMGLGPNSFFSKMHFKGKLLKLLSGFEPHTFLNAIILNRTIESIISKLMD